MTSTPVPSGHLWPRTYLIKILNAGFSARDFRFVRQTALTWLASYPGDLPVRFTRAEALMKEGLLQQAIPILQDLVSLDPEFTSAQVHLSKLGCELGVKGGEMAFGCSTALTGSPPNSLSRHLISKNPTWSLPLAKIRKSLQKGDVTSAETGIHYVLGNQDLDPLIAITHLLVLRAQDGAPRQAIYHLAEHYHQQWPECLQFVLLMAEALMESGESDQAVSLLHRAATQDVTGQVAQRLWGADHPYRKLWPAQLAAPMDVQIPARVAAVLGWNLLPASEPAAQSSEAGSRAKSSTPSQSQARPAAAARKRRAVRGRKTTLKPSPEPEILKSLQGELDRMARKMRHPGMALTDGRFPVYLIFTTRQGLEAHYGVETTRILEAALHKLVAAIRQRLDWGATLVYADDPASMGRFGVEPADWKDPWKLKLAIRDLDKALGKQGARIGALLIIGGPEVVPFHRLPNPTDDADSDVPSDNPYATRDENYFIPEWPVGRLPGGAGKDPGLLISALRSMTKHHQAYQPPAEGFLSRLWRRMAALFRPFTPKNKGSFGYSAEAWRRVSISVFKPIGDPRALVTSPPVEIYGKALLPSSRLGYFNLHGIPNSGVWFGQRDPAEGGEGPDYPVALHPQDIVNGGRAPEVVFTEACYGAHILQKEVEDAIALKFLSSGSQAVIGSTVISYGSVTPPLNAADLLGHAFWRYLKDGYPAGEALRRAKIYLAKEMHRRQGYLDGEDQKTLISFVLYGDPLAAASEGLTAGKGWATILRGTAPKLIETSDKPPERIKTVCDRVEVPGTSEPIPHEVIAHVKTVVEQYLPGMRGAHLTMSQEHAQCKGEGHTCPTCQLGPKSRPNRKPKRRVVTLSKQITRAQYTHEAFARLTLDKDGKVVKMAVSR